MGRSTGVGGEKGSASPSRANKSSYCSCGARTSKKLRCTHCSSLPTISQVSLIGPGSAVDLPVSGILGQSNRPAKRIKKWSAIPLSAKKSNAHSVQQCGLDCLFSVRRPTDGVPLWVPGPVHTSTHGHAQSCCSAALCSCLRNSLALASRCAVLLGNVLLCSLSPALRRAAKVSTALLGHECVSDSASL